MNKFNMYYSKLSIEELIDKLNMHIKTGNTLEEEWFDALIIHLGERETSPEEKNKIETILSKEYKEKLIEIKFDKLKKTEQFKEINESSKINSIHILEAGKALTKSVWMLIVMLISVIATLFIGFSTSQNGKNYQTLENSFIAAGIISLVFSLIIISQIYSAGDYLIRSVKSGNVE
jgi:formate-dependent nitrite reductase membrane component NrfD